MSADTKLRSRTKPPEERRHDLMDAAQHLFLKQGVAATTIEQITAGAEVAKGTFYLYFSSKEAVLAALGDRFAQNLLASIKTAVSKKPEKDWSGKLASWARVCINGYLDSIRLHDVVFYGHRPAAREGLVDNIIVNHLTGLLQAGVDAGEWSIDEARFTAVFLFNGLHASVDGAYTTEKRVDRTRLARRAEKLCFRAVGLPHR